MKPYKKDDIENIYSILLQNAVRSYESKHFDDAIKYVISSVKWAYNFNNIYADPEAEGLLKSISEAIVESRNIPSPIPNRCVLVDSFLIDNRGLSQQYLRAMIANNMDILVVFTNAGGSVGKDTLKEIQRYAKASILTFPKGTDYFEQTRHAVERIADFSPAHIFLHLIPWDMVALMACHAIKGSKIYNINLTDHAYWMGASFIDYNLEFRPYGMTISFEKRGLRQEQLIGLPYYPIAPVKAEFAGLPELPADAVKVFTGGALYKMLGKDDIFFRIMDCVLCVSPNVYIMVAGFNHDNRFDEKCAAMKHGDRVIQIGVRRDIDEVFKRCDIYLGTYPMTGGLMSQYAAKHKRPIIAFHNEGDVMNAVEEFVDYYGSGYKSLSSFDELTVYASKLIHEEAFRVEEGNRLHEGMMDEERFKNEFLSLISAGKTSFSWKKDNINYEAFFERYLDLENNNGFMATLDIAAKLKAKSITKLKGFRLNMLEALLFLSFNALMRKLKN